MAEFKEGREKTGGRQKGTPNKDRQRIVDLAKKLNVDPFEVQLLFAKNDHEALGYTQYQTKITKFGEVEELTISPELRQKSAAEICGYLLPKLKAVEFKDVSDGEKPALNMTIPENLLKGFLSLVGTEKANADE